MIEEFTTEEKKIILQALDLMFQTGVRGNIDTIEKTIITVKNIQSKLNVVEIEKIKQEL